MKRIETSELSLLIGAMHEKVSDILLACGWAEGPEVAARDRLAERLNKMIAIFNAELKDRGEQ